MPAPQGNDAFCILDCIFHEEDATYYIMDTMCWKGYSLYDCTTEFRLFWRDTKLAEEGDLGSAGAGPGSDSRYSFRSVPAYPCTPGIARSPDVSTHRFITKGPSLRFHRSIL